MKCAYEEKECSSACIHTKTCAKWKLRNGKAPCRDCGTRTEGCHTTCREYKHWLKNKQERNADIRKIKEKERDYDQQHSNIINRMKKRRR